MAHATEDREMDKVGTVFWKCVTGLEESLNGHTRLLWTCDDDEGPHGHLSVSPLSSVHL